MAFEALRKITVLQDNDIANRQVSGESMLVLVYVLTCLLWAIGPGLLTLLPQYMILQGAGPSLVGMIMAGAYLILCLGNLVISSISRPLNIRRDLIGCGLLLVLSALIMSENTGIPMLALGIAGMWFSFGLMTPLIKTQTALFSTRAKLGSNFSYLAALSGASALLGGFLLGILGEKLGYSPMLRIVAVISFIFPIVAWQFNRISKKHKENTFPLEKAPLHKNDGGLKNPTLLTGLPNSYLLFLIAVVLQSIAGFSARIAIPIIMTEAGFSAGPTGSTIAIGGLISIPFTLAAGRTMHRIQTRHLLTGCYLSIVLAMLVVLVAADLTHFWIVASLTSISFYTGGVARSTIITECVHSQDISRFMGQIDAAGFIGAPFGFICTGFLYERIGQVGIGLLFTCIGLASVVCLKASINNIYSQLRTND